MGCSLQLPRPVVPFPLGMGRSALSPGDPQPPGLLCRARVAPHRTGALSCSSPWPGSCHVPQLCGSFGLSEQAELCPEPLPGEVKQQVHVPGHGVTAAGPCSPVTRCP